MKSFIAVAGLAMGASAAAVAPRGECCFQLTASGGASGTIGQLSDGQNRIGGGYTPATYCINNGGITDKNGRGCILTPPTTQFQCDAGATPTYGFSIGTGGEVEYNGSGQFYACPVNDNGEYNLYTTPAPGQTKCVKVTLSTGGECVGGMSSKPAPSVVKTTQYETETKPAPTATETKPAPTATETKPAPSVVQTTHYYTTTILHTGTAPAEKTTMETVPTVPAEKTTMKTAPSSSPSATKPAGSACSASLTGAYQTPHLIVPVSSQQPNKAYGTQYNATISPEECTIFNFDIPSSYSGKTCSAVFLFPEQSQLTTSAYTFSGSGDLVFSSLNGVANQQTTWNNAPSKKSELGSIAIKSGNSYVVSSGSCAAGTTQSIEVCSSNGLSLEFFEDYNPSPLGLYITSC